MYNNYYQNKIAVVTGGGSGIGRGLCIRLAEANATVICTDIDLAKAEETVSLIGKGQVISKKLDITQLVDIENVIKETVTQYGRLDLIFNNAGIAVSGEIRDISANDWKKIIDINFFGVLNGSNAAYQQMLIQGFGQIVNIASAAGLIDHLALMAPYSVTKHAVVNYTKILSIEAKELGIMANVVCPGFISTSIGNNAIAPGAKQNWKDYAIKMVSKGISIDKAADHILRGVKSNKKVIVFPFEVRVIALFTRLFGSLYAMIMQKQVKDYRKNYRIND
jgi:NAD(P)-dependent dehydrogenase (short-subunit alcohol dehydrogenase family)